MRGTMKYIIWAAAALIAVATPAAAGPVTTTLQVKGGGNGPSSERVTLGLNKAAIIELPADAADVLVSNPAIVDAIVRTPRRIYILGLTVGQTNAFFINQFKQLYITAMSGQAWVNFRLQDIVDTLFDTGIGTDFWHF